MLHIAPRLFTHISTAVYSQVLIYTAEWTGASWRERKCLIFETAAKRIRTRPGSLGWESAILPLSYYGLAMKNSEINVTRYLQTWRCRAFEEEDAKEYIQPVIRANILPFQTSRVCFACHTFWHTLCCFVLLGGRGCPTPASATPVTRRARPSGGRITRHYCNKVQVKLQNVDNLHSKRSITAAVIIIIIIIVILQ